MKEAKTLTDVEQETMYQAGEFRIKQEIKSDGRDAMLLTLLYLDLY